MNELTIDGKQYISSKKAADITGYAKDYVGQLCREGHVEARMVGRSWYVLESSIRAHRFGGDSTDTTPVPEPTEATPLDTWEKPTYIPETIPSMPILPVQQPESDTVPATTAETLTDMQSAWKEWFAQKQDHLIESPEIIDAREEEQEEAAEEPVQDEPEEEELPLEAPEPVSIHTIEEEEPVFEAADDEEGELEPESEPVLIHHVAPAAAPMPRVQYYQEEEIEHIPTKQERKQARAQKARAHRKGYLGPIVIRAVLLALIGITIAVTAISSGFADRYVHPGTPSQPLFNFLGGTSIYTK